VSEQPRDTNDLVRQREEKLEALRRRGIDPFGGRYPVTHWRAISPRGWRRPPTPSWTRSAP